MFSSEIWIEYFAAATELLSWDLFSISWLTPPGLTSPRCSLRIYIIAKQFVAPQRHRPLSRLHRIFHYHCSLLTVTVSTWAKTPPPNLDLLAPRRLLLHLLEIHPQNSRTVLQSLDLLLLSRQSSFVLVEPGGSMSSFSRMPSPSSETPLSILLLRAHPSTWVQRTAQTLWPPWWVSWLLFKYLTGCEKKYWLGTCHAGHTLPVGTLRGWPCLLWRRP